MWQMKSQVSVFLRYNNVETYFGLRKENESLRLAECRVDE